MTLGKLLHIVVENRNAVDVMRTVLLQTAWKV